MITNPIIRDLHGLLIRLYILQAHGLTALRDMTRDSAYQRRTVERNGLFHVMLALNRFVNNEMIQSTAFAVLRNLAMLKENRVKMFDSIALILSGMRGNETVVSVQGTAIFFFVQVPVYVCVFV